MAPLWMWKYNTRRRDKTRRPRYKLYLYFVYLSARYHDWQRRNKPVNFSDREICSISVSFCKFSMIDWFGVRVLAALSLVFVFCVIPICVGWYGCFSRVALLADCDICNSWLHYECENITPEEETKLDDPGTSYICILCTYLKSHDIIVQRTYGNIKSKPFLQNFF
jgi:hypothetical protein